jgi:hypothetical protein
MAGGRRHPQPSEFGIHRSGLRRRISGQTSTRHDADQSTFECQSIGEAYVSTYAYGDERALKAFVKLRQRFPRESVLKLAAIHLKTLSGVYGSERFSVDDDRPNGRV